MYITAINLGTKNHKVIRSKKKKKIDLCEPVKTNDKREDDFYVYYFIDQRFVKPDDYRCYHYVLL